MTGLTSRFTLLLLSLLSTALTSFGWWGLETTAGMQAFDEMDGLIPFFAGVVGIAGLCALALAALFRRFWS